MFGTGTIAAPITFGNNPTPAPPTLSASTSTVILGQTEETVTLSGLNWTGNPSFGSPTSPTGPGQTQLSIEICGIGGDPNACSTQTGTGSVALTRVRNEALSGASLVDASITVGPDLAGGCNTCFVRVRQELFGQPGAFIEATAPLRVLPPVDLSLDKAASADPVPVRSELTYTIAVTNNGPAQATGVVVTDSLSDGVRLLSTTSTQGTCSEGKGKDRGVLTCALGNVTAGGNATITLVVRTSPRPETITNTATVSTANQYDTNEANNSDSVNTTLVR